MAGGEATYPCCSVASLSSQALPFGADNDAVAVGVQPAARWNARTVKTDSRFTFNDVIRERPARRGAKGVHTQVSRGKHDLGRAHSYG